MHRMRVGIGVVGAALGLAAVAPGELIYGITQQQRLVSWDSSNPADVTSGVALTGLGINETVMGIDVRPATGELYALGSQSRLYRINPATGAATQVGGVFNPPLSGTNFGFDFNPVADAIRVVSGSEQNLRINADTSQVTVDGPLNFSDPNDPGFGTDPAIVHAAYTAGPQTMLYGICTTRDTLVRINPPNLGSISTVGPLGIDALEQGGFDIGPSGVAYATMSSVELDQHAFFYSIDLNTGAATNLGEVGGGIFIVAMTVVPEPSTLVVLALGALAARRRA